jgi:hypothetical protein
MAPLQLFQLLHGRPGGMLVFRALVRLRCWWRQLCTWALNHLLIADLPLRGWAWRERLQLSSEWQRDLSDLRYIEAQLTRQPD